MVISNVNTFIHYSLNHYYHINVDEIGEINFDKSTSRSISNITYNSSKKTIIMIYILFF